MFTERSLPAAVSTVRDEHASDALVLDCASDFETLPPAQAEELSLLTDRLEPASHPDAWLPADAPDQLVQYAGGAFTIGMPGDGSVVWTRQTTPPVVLCKSRLEGTPDAFASFLVAEALVEVGVGVPEQFLPFFGEQYAALATATGDHLDPAGTYQLAVACYDAFVGLHTRGVFADWDGPLFDAWLDAGERVEPRLEGLSRAVARGEMDFPEAAELACSALKHGGELPAPFDALDTAAYRDHGASYAVEWAERVLAEL